MKIFHCFAVMLSNDVKIDKQYVSSALWKNHEKFLLHYVDEITIVSDALLH